MSANPDDTAQRVADHIKQRLKQEGSHDWAEISGYDTSGYYATVDWNKLSAEIDTFCEEFRQKRLREGKPA